MKFLKLDSKFFITAYTYSKYVSEVFICGVGVHPLETSPLQILRSYVLRKYHVSQENKIFPRTSIAFDS